jgi:hypothetical protein
LEGGHVPAALAAVHDTRAKARAAAAAERLTCLRPRHAVDQEAVLLLERAHPLLGKGALHAVDRDGIEAECLEGYLKRGHVGAARSCLLRETQRKRPCEYDHAG